MSDPPDERRRMVRPPTGGDPAGRGFGARLKTADKRTLVMANGVFKILKKDS